ncbi:hypothetical protein PL85_13515 [Vibrio anguillarum]|uniref:DUF5718 family protein n=3 Tax=Vibrio anguillarum TaxID=55601 RepID=UPI00097E1A0C|nr:DUF5718 family protein [Vibrio anguillarum]MBF4281644.1 hypothetical protein [Vibrio anguillarum]MBF4288499.1 hypothetical protein [Vibrio anguillarum]MBF4341313.1 hypothetical protein [Vibrio anguillarum]MBF4356016.1 hypothetical protein [Vibrio anguillarum]MBF4380064.1 hypothetical protein [Vibrio anguillarum]
MLCIGIIGNYSGHLSGAEQVQETALPNGIFVIDCSHPETLTSGKIIYYPRSGSKVDIEPEFVIRCQVSYEQGKVSALMPKQLTIGNDFTIRELTGSNKIDQRKSWGECSKGINHYWWDVLRLSPSNYGENLKLISYIERDGDFYLATPEVDCTELKIFYCHLMVWLTNVINNQVDEGMYSTILPEIEKQGFPNELILFTGAPNYTYWGDMNFIQKGDKVHIAAYDINHTNEDEIKRMFKSQYIINNQYILSLSQHII